jgi:hypothetical protein
MQKKCIMCGKPFEPYAPLKNKQICCSKECGRMRRLEMQREYEKTGKMKKYRAEYYKERTKNKTLCGICGKPTVAEDTTHKPQYHLECILNESIEAYKSGQILTDAQYLRLYSRGYTMRDIKRIVREREKQWAE